MSLHPVNRMTDPDALDDTFLAWLMSVHLTYTPQQRRLAAERKRRLAAARSDLDLRPDHMRVAPWQVRQDWRITLPDFLRDQRNQMTGPADDAELCVKMLNSGSPGVMLDLEDSMANQWSNTAVGIRNAVAALHGELMYEKGGKLIGIKPSKTVTFVRARGLHMSQHGVFDEPVSASLFDVASIVWNVDPAKLAHPLCFYIPKSESAEEAGWWADVFKALARNKGLPDDAIKCMALVESHPLAFQMEEFIWRLRDHLTGLNLGRWDYMASLIHWNLSDPAWVLPDRDGIPSDVEFFQRLRYLMVEICHRRGILAEGGMTALFPDRTDPALNATALSELERDKRNESNVGMDGAWTGHPDQNEIAVAQFPDPNQLHIRHPDRDRFPDLRPLPIGIGQVTEEGTRRAIRATIQYRTGILNGKGASLIRRPKDGAPVMEDLATDRIFRLMIAQRIAHGFTTLAAVALAYDEEAAKLGGDLKTEAAARLSLGIITAGEFDPS